MIVGDSGVGKSSCLFRYADEYYDEARTLSTIGIQRHQDHGREYHVCATGVDFRIVHRTVADRLIKVQIWDTAGQVSSSRVLPLGRPHSAGLGTVQDDRSLILPRRRRPRAGLRCELD